MTHQYNITGMTCNNCVAKVKSELLKLPDVLSADVQLAGPQATITMNHHTSVQQLQAAVHKAGNYTIEEHASDMHETVLDTPRGLAAYKPIFLVFAYILGASLLVQFTSSGFDMMQWMRHFMAGFFLTFSFFKMLDLKGFSDSYSTYDIVARRWAGWGYLYAFIELGLGIAFLLNFQPAATNLVTAIVMTISIIGVLQSVLNKRKIKCACLGAVFNLPMSTVTIVEDALMIAMSVVMLFILL